jgi:hypothetical protein
MTTHTSSANTRRAPPMPAILPTPPKKRKTKKPVNAKHRSSTTPLRALCKHWKQVGEKLQSRQGLVWKRGAGGEGPRARRRSNPSCGGESELSTSDYGRRMKTRFQHLRTYFRPLIAHLVPKQYLPCSPISLACLLIQHNQSLLLSVLSHLRIKGRLSVWIAKKLGLVCFWLVATFFEVLFLVSHHQKFVVIHSDVVT